ncbi:MAG TPA: cytochrome c biogenesis protein CcsA, partial [Pirellulaceae bacterium]|nr:cytochrome c biogenesis protein CcsA [Pirellulaceae bacterium]
AADHATVVGVMDANVWDAWRELPVLHDGRVMPLDTFSRRLVRRWTGDERIVDASSGRSIDPVEYAVRLILDWQGWDHPDNRQLLIVKDWRGHYSHLHPGDSWDAQPLWRIETESLRSLVGLAPTDASAVSARQLSETQVIEADAERPLPLTSWAQKLAERGNAGETLAPLEQQTLALVDRNSEFRNHRMGRTLVCMRADRDGDGSTEWLSLADAVLPTLDDTSDPGGELRTIQSLWSEVRGAYRAGERQRFEAASAALVAELKSRYEAQSRAASGGGTEPTAAALSWEVRYNRWSLVNWTRLLLLVTSLAGLAGIVTGRRRGALDDSVSDGSSDDSSGSHCVRLARITAWIGGALALITAGTAIAMRLGLAGLPPATDLSETLFYVGVGTLTSGLFVERIDRRRVVLMSTSAAAFVLITLAVADGLPLPSTGSSQQLVAGSTSSIYAAGRAWTTAWQLASWTSYSALTLAAAIACASLISTGLTRWKADRNDGRAQSHSQLQQHSQLIYRALQTGAAFLAAALLCGAIGSAELSGRLWDWSPREITSVLTLLAYLGLIRLSDARLLGPRTLPLATA